jgi:hypothetical protein
VIEARLAGPPQSGRVYAAELLFNHYQNGLPYVLGKVIPGSDNPLQFWVHGHLVFAIEFYLPKPPNFRRHDTVWYVTFSKGRSFSL